MKPFTKFLWTLAGPIIWAGHFFAIYIAEALVCTASSPSSFAMRAAALLLTVLALILLVGVVFSRREAIPSMGRITEVRDRDFLASFALLLALLSSLAVIWAAVPAFVMPVCAFGPG